MRFKVFAAAAMLGAASLGLSACAPTLNATVSRYQAMPAPQGQTFSVVPGEGMAARGGLEFEHYAGLVSQQLAARGYAPAASAGSANLIVQLGYGVDRGQVRYMGDPFFNGFWGRGFYRPWGWGRSAWGFGWGDPFFDDGIDSYIEYHGEVELHIRAAGSGQPLFDGRAQARSDTNRLDVLVPNLVDALFAGFPGQNGEVIKITVPAHRR